MTSELYPFFYPEESDPRWGKPVQEPASAKGNDEEKEFLKNAWWLCPPLGKKSQNTGGKVNVEDLRHCCGWATQGEGEEAVKNARPTCLTAEGKLMILPSGKGNFYGRLFDPYEDEALRTGNVHVNVQDVRMPFMPDFMYQALLAKTQTSSKSDSKTNDAVATQRGVDGPKKHTPERANVKNRTTITKEDEKEDDPVTTETLVSKEEAKNQPTESQKMAVFRAKVPELPVDTSTDMGERLSESIVNGSGPTGQEKSRIVKSPLHKESPADGQKPVGSKATKPSNNSGNAQSKASSLANRNLEAFRAQKKTSSTASETLDTADSPVEKDKKPQRTETSAPSSVHMWPELHKTHSQKTGKIEEKSVADKKTMNSSDQPQDESDPLDDSEPMEETTVVQEREEAKKGKSSDENVEITKEKSNDDKEVAKKGGSRKSKAEAKEKAGENAKTGEKLAGDKAEPKRKEAKEKAETKAPAAKESSDAKARTSAEMENAKEKSEEAKKSAKGDKDTSGNLEKDIENGEDSTRSSKNKRPPVLTKKSEHESSVSRKSDGEGENRAKNSTVSQKTRHVEDQEIEADERGGKDEEEEDDEFDSGEEKSTVNKSANDEQMAAQYPGSEDDDSDVMDKEDEEGLFDKELRENALKKAFSQYHHIHKGESVKKAIDKDSNSSENKSSKSTEDKDEGDKKRKKASASVEPEKKRGKKTDGDAQQKKATVDSKKKVSDTKKVTIAEPQKPKGRPRKQPGAAPVKRKQSAEPKKKRRSKADEISQQEVPSKKQKPDNYDYVIKLLTDQQMLDIRPISECNPFGLFTPDAPLGPRDYYEQNNMAMVARVMKLYNFKPMPFE